MSSSTLDSIDRHILYELDRASNRSYSDISRKLKVSHDTVRYRIQRLERSGAIGKYQTGLNWTAIGFQVYELLIRLHSTREENSESIFEWLVNAPQVTWVVRLTGGFDIALALHVRNAKELADFLDAFLKESSLIVRDRVMMLNVLHEYLSRDYLLPPKERPQKRSTVYVPTESKQTTLDENDREILVILGENSRYSATEIERKISQRKNIPPLTRTQIVYRINQLEQVGIIGGYPLFLNQKRLARKRYKVLFYFHHTKPNESKRFLKACRLSPHCTFMVRQLGSFDYEIDLEVESKREFQELLGELLESHPHAIRNYLVLEVEKEYLFGSHSALATQ